GSASGLSSMARSKNPTAAAWAPSDVARSPAVRSARGLGDQDHRHRCAGILEGPPVVVGEHLRVVLGPPERLDPSRCPSMPLGSIPPWDLRVGHIAEQDVLEGVLGFAGDGGPPGPPDEPLALQ